MFSSVNGHVGEYRGVVVAVTVSTVLDDSCGIAYFERLGGFSVPWWARLAPSVSSAVLDIVSEML